MPRKVRTLEERVDGLEEGLADLAALVEDVYALLSAESVHRLAARGLTVKAIAEAMGRPMPYVRKVLKDS